MRTTQPGASFSCVTKPDNSMSDVRLEPCSNDVTTTPQSQGQRAVVTTVQITPCKAPTDMTDAIRRQRRTCGIGYFKGNPSISNAKPLFRAVLTGGLQCNQMQCTIHTGHGLNGNFNDSFNNNTRNSSSVGDSGFCSNRSLTNGVSGSKPSYTQTVVSKIITENGGDGGYSVIYNKQSNAALASPEGFSNGQTDINAYNNKSAQRNPKLSLTHRAKAHSISDYPDSLNKLLTPDSLSVNGKDEKLTEQKKLTEDSKRCSPRENRTNSLPGCLKRSQTIDESNVQISKEENSLSTLSRASDTKGNIQSKSSDSETSRKLSRLPKSKSLDSKGSTQKQTSVQGLSCLQFADSILGAVNNDLNQIYQLCQSKVRYSEFIEKTHPHRLGNRNGRLKDGLTHQTQISNLGSPRSSSTMACTLPKKLATLPDLPVKPRQLFRPKPTLDATASTTPTVSLKKQQATEEEPEIDYDKPVTIIIETDDNHSKTLNTRPILKSKVKTEIPHSCEGSSNDSSNDKNNNLVPYYLNSEACTKMARESTSNAESSYSPLRCSVKDKGRLVRFSADHKIHEFAPSEPVTQNS